ncbi:hypothetical protein AV926_11860 [Myroides marinus]|uniref:Acb2/Tad1 hairpin domain-containing protein n=1 Tax=Myroides marinus TaxID=703342 RepID=A0A163YJ56_9FLAO|nr:hypothetical protein [Myroides marinus]KUF38942.1 hypothetical protein AS361_03605 [Myroides marinus]KZE79503.1 hypothetical protein AV926_11860 [Myroides marinus]
MSDFKTRLEIEASELREKHSGLKNFLNNDAVNKIDPKQKIWLVEQFHYMDGYLNTLDKRLASLNGEEIECKLTIGMERVGLSFNPSGSPVVHLTKTIAASLIDLGEELKASGNNARCVSIGQTEVETACMYLVKSNF